MTKKKEPTRQSTDELVNLFDAADALPSVRELRARSYELLRVAPETAVMDGGCGAGCAVAEMAERHRQAVPGPGFVGTDFQRSFSDKPLRGGQQERGEPPVLVQPLSLTSAFSVARFRTSL